MRVWDRYYVVNGSKVPSSGRKASDIYDNEHMQACQKASYTTREEFFDGYTHGSPRRYGYYYEYLRKNISKDGQGLSIGSGQCISELRLISEGYCIQCSDIAEAYNQEVKRLFPEFKFSKLNIIESPFPDKVDYVISLSMVFSFDSAQLTRVFQNVAASLKAGGMFFVESSGAEDGVSTMLIDNYLCRYDASVQYVIKKFLLNKDVSFVKVFHGYRFRDEEVVALAQKAGFVLEDIKRFDYVTELKDRLLLFNRLPDAIVSCFGRAVPYIRFLKFRKI